VSKQLRVKKLVWERRQYLVAMHVALGACDYLIYDWGNGSFTLCSGHWEARPVKSVEAGKALAWELWLDEVCEIAEDVVRMRSGVACEVLEDVLVFDV